MSLCKTQSTPPQFNGAHSKLPQRTRIDAETEIVKPANTIATLATRAAAATKGNKREKVK